MNIVWHQHTVTKQSRATQKKQRPCIIWFTGLSGSGKSTIAGALEQKLNALSQHTYLLDGGNVRHGLNKDLGFSDPGRIENIRSVGEKSKLFVDVGLIVLSAFISPFRTARRMVRDLVEKGGFIAVHMDTPIVICETRNPKGLYKKARAGEIKNITGIDSERPTPEDAEGVLITLTQSLKKCAATIIAYLVGVNILQVDALKALAKPTPS